MAAMPGQRVGRVLAALLLSWLLANAPGRAMENVPSAWALVVLAGNSRVSDFLGEAGAALLWWLREC